MEQTLHDENTPPEDGGKGTPLLGRPLVLLALLALVVGTLVWAFTRPGGPGDDAEEEPSADQLALRRAAASGKLRQFLSEAQRLYRRGLGQCREGDVVGARQTWEDVSTMFRNVEDERLWVELATRGLDLLKDHEQPAEARVEAVRAALRRIEELRDAGKEEEAQRLRSALEGLYRDEPAARELLGATSPKR